MVDLKNLMRQVGLVQTVELVFQTLRDDMAGMTFRDIGDPGCVETAMNRIEKHIGFILGCPGFAKILLMLTPGQRYLLAAAILNEIEASSTEPLDFHYEGEVFVIFLHSKQPEGVTLKVV